MISLSPLTFSYIPFSGRNPRFNQMVTRRPKILVLNKMDMADSRTSQVCTSTYVHVHTYIHTRLFKEVTGEWNVSICTYICVCPDIRIPACEGVFVICRLPNISNLCMQFSAGNLVVYTKYLCLCVLYTGDSAVASTEWREEHSVHQLSISTSLLH